MPLLRQAEQADPILAAGVAEARRRFAIGRQILKHRKQARLTQAQLAEIVGTSQPAIARLESADYGRFSYTTIEKIAKALGLELTVSLNDPSTPPKPHTKSARTQATRTVLIGTTE